MGLGSWQSVGALDGFEPSLTTFALILRPSSCTFDCCMLVFF